MPRSISDRAEILQRIKRNLVLVFTGKTVSYPLGLLALAMNSRALGPSGLGFLALITAYSATINQVLAFNTWRPLIRLATEARSRDDDSTAEVSRLLSLSLAYDMAAALSSALIGATAVYVAGPILSLPNDTQNLTTFFLIANAGAVIGTPIGILRLYDRFDSITIFDVAYSATLCAASALLLTANAPVSVYVVTFATISAIRQLALLGFALRVARQDGVRAQLRTILNAPREQVSQFWSFSWASSAISTTTAIKSSGTLFFLGAVSGTEMVGIYQLALRISETARNALDPLLQVIYPELARLASMGQRTEIPFYVMRAGMVCGAVGAIGTLGAYLLGSWALKLLAGASYLAAHAPLVLLMLSTTISLSGIGLIPATLSTAGPLTLLRCQLIALMGFLAVAPWAIPQLQATGAALAQVTFHLGSWLATALALRTALSGPGNGSEASYDSAEAPAREPLTR